LCPQGVHKSGVPDAPGAICSGMPRYSVIRRWWRPRRRSRRCSWCTATGSAATPCAWSTARSGSAPADRELCPGQYRGMLGLQSLQLRPARITFLAAAFTAGARGRGRQLLLGFTEHRCERSAPSHDHAKDLAVGLTRDRIRSGESDRASPRSRPRLDSVSEPVQPDRRAADLRAKITFEVPAAAPKRRVFGLLGT
jgi:hypothetical protein